MSDNPIHTLKAELEAEKKAFKAKEDALIDKEVAIALEKGELLAQANTLRLKELKLQQMDSSLYLKMIDSAKPFTIATGYAKELEGEAYILKTDNKGKDQIYSSRHNEPISAEKVALLINLMEKEPKAFIKNLSEENAHLKKSAEAFWDKDNTNAQKIEPIVLPGENKPSSPIKTQKMGL